MSESKEFFASIESERLLIRVAQPGDGKVFNAAILESQAQLAPWLAWVSPPPTLAESEFSCRRAYAKFLLQEDLMVFFFLKENGELVGGSGLHKPDWKLRQFEVGYWGRSKYAKQGLMTEGVKTLVQQAFAQLGASRVFLTTDEKNLNSIKLATAAGFVLEGTLRHERLDLEGKLRNTRVYALVKGLDI